MFSNKSYLFISLAALKLHQGRAWREGFSD